MNRLNYFLVLVVTLFILLSLFTTPQSFKSYLNSEINTTIPEEFEVAKPIKLTKIPFDIDAFSEAKENNAIESINSIEAMPSWTILVEEYEDQDDLMTDFKILKERGLKAYIQYKENEENQFVLYIGPTMDRSDSRDNLAKISDLIQFSPKIIPYD